MDDAQIRWVDEMRAIISEDQLHVDQLNREIEFRETELNYLKDRLNHNEALRDQRSANVLAYIEDNKED